MTGPDPYELDGWKAVAKCLGFGVRTVQKYEAELGLPVQRLAWPPLTGQSPKERA